MIGWLTVEELNRRLRNMGRDAIAQAHAAGYPAWYSDAQHRIIRHDPDGSRWYVRLGPEGDEKVLGPVES